uniref:Uncharacterized protein n=1 Tax=Guillardia theta TaxID=55529 RepID=A0A7S4JFV0_GUITH|mmetsp:Transcript_16109/g.54017  ORF Transcript_16109/g.54017 Transcript_16109/m.54017 type:complete len:125 (+) Transcript_16109:412-786(+)
MMVVGFRSTSISSWQTCILDVLDSVSKRTQDVAVLAAQFVPRQQVVRENLVLNVKFDGEGLETCQVFSVWRQHLGKLAEAVRPLPPPEQLTKSIRLMDAKFRQVGGGTKNSCPYCFADFFLATN